MSTRRTTQARRRDGRFDFSARAEAQAPSLSTSPETDDAIELIRATLGGRVIHDETIADLDVESREQFRLFG